MSEKLQYVLGLLMLLSISAVTHAFTTYIALLIDPTISLSHAIGISCLFWASLGLLIPAAGALLDHVTGD